MAKEECGLQVKVGGAHWRDLRVRQFDITETMPAAEAVPEGFCFTEEIAGKVGGKEKEEGAENEAAADVVASGFADGGKHAYMAAEQNASDFVDMLIPEEQKELLTSHVDGEEMDPEEDCVEDESLPDWIAALKGVRFFTYKQALASPATMEISASAV